MEEDFTIPETTKALIYYSLYNLFKEDVDLRFARGYAQGFRMGSKIRELADKIRAANFSKVFCEEIGEYVLAEG